MEISKKITKIPEQKNTMTELRNSPASFRSRLDEVEEIISSLQDRSLK